MAFPQSSGCSVLVLYILLPGSTCNRAKTMQRASYSCIGFTNWADSTGPAMLRTVWSG
ncbi:hypothetical protein M758_8G124100 [Ceratodon purpureus]|uniref:Uncharacterized protein n=1 Tax=Ceratodon purpureus TaxID=3225 RepID=A0A8T0H6D5_CERPU|nr:hypothetical protein KC19_8G130000 [Ceratodon purpureus]KAG0608682.1 hypothetical protein M758_8G124100 [Ceratodon purpureus]